MADETPPPPPVPQPVARTSPVAIWTLVLAILSFTCGWLFTAIPAVICGHIARSKIRKSCGALRGKGIATAGLLFRLCSGGPRSHGHPVTCQHDPVSPGAVA